MRMLFTIAALSLTLGSIAQAYSTPVSDANSRGYSFQLSELGFETGTPGLASDQPSVRLFISHPMKNGNSIKAVDSTSTDRDQKIQRQVNEICLDMFGTEERLKAYDVIGSGYSYTNVITSLECAIAFRK